MHAATLPKTTTLNREVDTGTLRETPGSFNDGLSDHKTSVSISSPPYVAPTSSVHLDVSGDEWTPVKNNSNHSETNTTSQDFFKSIHHPDPDNISFNRHSMYAPHLPQQVEINIHNYLPRGMSYLSSSDHLGVPPPPIDKLSLLGGTSLLDESQIPRVPPPPPPEFEDSLLSPLSDLLPPLPVTPPPMTSGTMKRFSHYSSSTSLSRIPENEPSSMSSLRSLTEQLGSTSVLVPKLTFKVNQCEGMQISRAHENEPLSPASKAKIIRPQVPPPPIPYPTKKIPPPVPAKSSKLRSFKSEETLLDAEGSTSSVLSKRTVPRPVSLIATNLQRFGFSRGNLGTTGTTMKPPQSPTNNPVKQSVSDRKKFFETAMEKSQKPSKQDKVFSYLSADELEKLKAEEDRKIATLSHSELLSLQELEHSDGETVDPLSSRPSSTIGVVRTAKAEKRLRDRMREEGLLTDDEDGPYGLSPAEERTLRAEKRAAWRAARLKSLEQDAIQAQMVIKSMTDMVGGAQTHGIPDAREQADTNRVACNIDLRPSSADFPKLEVRTMPGDTRTVRENETVLDEKVTRRTEEYVDEMGEIRVRTVEYVEKTIEKEVEQIQEKIISLELTKPDDSKQDLSDKNIARVEDDEDESLSEPPTPTIDQEQIDFTDVSTNKKRRRRKSKKGKN